MLAAIASSPHWRLRGRRSRRRTNRRQAATVESATPAARRQRAHRDNRRHPSCAAGPSGQSASRAAPLDPGQQHGPPAAARERLYPMGNRAKEDEIVGRASASQPEPARGPDVVELEPTEAVVEDPEPPEDATAVASPYLRSHRSGGTGSGGRGTPRRWRVG